MTSARVTPPKISSATITGARTPSYMFTVDSLDDPMLLQLRENCKAHNKSLRAFLIKSKQYAGSWGWLNTGPRLMRVAVMPRGPRRAPARKDYGHHDCETYPHYDSYLPARYATHFDVYFRPDTTAEANFNNS